MSEKSKAYEMTVYGGRVLHAPSPEVIVGNVAPDRGPVVGMKRKLVPAKAKNRRDLVDSEKKGKANADKKGVV